MTKPNMAALTAILLLVFLHIAYSFETRKDILEGAYFTTGTTTMSSGETFNVLIRLQSHDNKIHDFEKINSYSQKFAFTSVSSLMGSARFLTTPVGGDALLKSMSLQDRDIAFNYAYLSSYSSRLTFYKLNLDPQAPCFYIKELERVLCLGAERIRSAPPL